MAAGSNSLHATGSGFPLDTNSPLPKRIRGQGLGKREPREPAVADQF
jgi:hypothetical protein